MNVRSESVARFAAKGAVHAVPLGRQRPDLTSLLRRPAWMADALCREYPEVSFLGESRRAKRICARCLAQQECRAYGLEHETAIDTQTGGLGCGIWGGLSAVDRRRLHDGLEVEPPPKTAAERLAEACPEPMTEREVCDLLQESPGTVRMWTDDGYLPFVRTQHGRRYARADVEALRDAP